MHAKATELTRQARDAGYEVVQCEQLRANRWLLRLKDTTGELVLLMAQQRSLLTSADVQDLAELLYLYRCASGMLLAIDGTFSAEARRTATELRRGTIHLCTDLVRTDAAQAAPTGALKAV